eukprot:768191-Hanusia_phi.AAC.3
MNVTSKRLVIEDRPGPALVEHEAHACSYTVLVHDVIMRPTSIPAHHTLGMIHTRKTTTSGGVLDG